MLCIGTSSSNPLAVSSIRDCKKTQAENSTPLALLTPIKDLTFLGKPPKPNTSDEKLPPELKDIASSKLQRRIANAIAWVVKNPGDKVLSLPVNLMRLRLPNLKRVRFDSADIKPFQLNGYWSPALKDSKACVMLVHGYYGGPRNMVSLAEKLNDHGYNVFMPELRAHGKRGNHRESTIGVLEGADILGAIKYLDKDFKEQAQNLHLLGHSMGAVSIMTLQACIREEDRNYLDQRVQKIILDSPYASRASALNTRAENIYNNGWVQRHPHLRKYTQGVCKAFLENMHAQVQREVENMHAQVQREVENMHAQAQREGFPDEISDILPADIMNRHPEWRKKGVLLIHGEKDTSTPFWMGRRLMRHSNGRGEDTNFSLCPMPIMSAKTMSSQNQGGRLNRRSLVERRITRS